MANTTERAAGAVTGPPAAEPPAGDTAGDAAGTAAGRHGLFPTLSDEEVRCLAEHGDTIRLATGEQLFAEGEPATSLFVVLDGAVRITKKIGTGDVVITIHHPREFTGELSLLT